MDKKKQNQDLEQEDLRQYKEDFLIEYIDEHGLFQQC